MKKIISLGMLCIVVLLITTNTYGQANPFINIISSNSGIVSVGGTIDVMVFVGNTGPSAAIPPAKLRPITQVPTSVTFLPNAQQTGLPAGWTILTNSGSQIRVCNTSRTLPVNTIDTIILKATGVTIAPAQPVVANINFGLGTSCAPGPAVNGDIITDNSASTTIQVVAPPAAISVTTIPNACNGQQAAKINASIAGLPGTLTWTLAPVAGTNNNDGTFEGLPAGTYTVSVSNGSTSTQTTVVLTDPPALSNSVTVVPPACNNFTNGSITLSSNGGTPYAGAPGPYLVELWQGTTASGTQLNVGGSAGSITFGNLAAGQYFVTIEDSAACVDTLSNIVVANPTAVSLTATATQIDCHGNTGSAALVGAGGTGALSYTLGTAPVTSPVLGLVSGVYTFTATDTKGCTSTSTVEINVAPPALTVSLSATAPLCAGGNGSIVALPAGGTPLATGTFPNNYYYGETGTNTNNTFSQPSGSYTITVRDANGCSATSTVVVPVTAPITNSVTVSQFGSYVIPGTTTTVTVSGIYNQVYTAANTCDSTVTYDVTINNGIVLCAKAFLSGAYNVGTGLMSDSLRQKGLLPLSTPYGSGAYVTGYATVNNTSSEVTNSGVFAVTGANAIVDWVFLQLRSSADSSVVVATRSALIQRDGDVVDVDGVSPVTFATSLNGEYYVSIKHRNHIGIMTANKYQLSLMPNCVDFTVSATPLFVRVGGPAATANPAPLTGPTRQQGGIRSLYAGNCNIISVPTSRIITYNSTTTSDRHALFTATGGTNTINGYSIFDVDLNGFARFNGLNPDRLVIISNCAGSNIIVTHEQTPN